MGRINSQIKGSSLVEVLISMIIIMIVMIFTTIILFSVLRSNVLLQRMKAHSFIKGVSAKAIMEKSFIDADLNIDGIMISQRFSDYGDNKELQLMLIQATDTTGRVLAIHRKIIVSE